MKWTRHKVEINNLDNFCKEYLGVIKKGEVDLSHLYCIFKLSDDDSIFYMYSIFDFLDSYLKQIITKDKILVFYTSQPSNG